MSEPLQRFFAVTLTSIYRVEATKDERGVPIVEKIALHGRSASQIGARLKDGAFVGITGRCGIMVYFEDFSPHSEHKRTQRPEEVNIRYWGGHTSQIVALFLTEEEASACFESNDLGPCDARWLDKTREVLTLIGDDHPVFVLARDHTLRLEVA